MNWSKVFEVGLKVVVAVGAGLAVFMGVSGAMENETRKNQRVAENTNPVEGNEGNVEKNINTTEPKSSVVVSGLRAAQNTCGKLFNLAQGLVTVAESVGAFTNGASNYNYPNYGGYGYYPPQMQCGESWRRINPFIIESIPPQGAPINYNTRYPY